MKPPHRMAIVDHELQQRSPKNEPTSKPRAEGRYRSGCINRMFSIESFGVLPPTIQPLQWK